MDSKNNHLNALVDTDIYIQYMMSSAEPKPEDKETFTTNNLSASDSNPMQFSLTTEDKNKLKHILESWNMGYLYQTCVDECVGFQALHGINKHQISLLLKNYEMGVTMKFERCVQLLQAFYRQRDVNEPNSEPSTSRV